MIDPITLTVAANWAVGVLKDGILGKLKEGLLTITGINKPAPDTRLLLDEVQQNLTRRSDQLQQDLTNRMDEDRLSKLYGALAELRDAPRTGQKKASIQQALTSFYQLSNIPETGSSGEYPNSYIRARAFLGLAAGHTALGAADTLIVEELLQALAADPAMVTQWVSKEFVTKVTKKFPELIPSSTKQLPQSFDTQPGYTPSGSGSLKLPPLILQPGRPASTWKQKIIESTLSLSLTTGEQGALIDSIEGSFHSVAWSPDGKYIAAVTNTSIKVWKVGMQGISEHLTLEKDQSTAGYSLAFSPDGQYIAISCADKKAIHVYQIETARKNVIYMVFSKLYGLTWSPDGKYIATIGSSDSAFYLYKKTQDFFLYVADAKSKKKFYAQKLFTYDTAIVDCNVCWSQNGRWIAVGSTASNATKILNADTGKESQSFALAQSKQVSSIAFSPDSSAIAMCGEGGETLVVSLTTRRTLSSESFKGTQKVAWSPDGKTIAYAGTQGISLLSNPGWRSLYTYTKQNGSHRSLGWAPDNARIVSTSADDFLRLIVKGINTPSSRSSNASLQIWQAI